MHVYIYGLVRGLCLETIFIAMAVKRSDREELEKVFRKYATVHKDDTWYITNKDFVCRYLQLVDTDTSSETIKLLAEVADTTKDGLVSVEEFRTFETLLCTPDAINQLAFKLFDVSNKGRVCYDDFHYVLSHTTTHTNIPFNFNSTFVKQYFGDQKQHLLDYFEFCQLLQSLPTEHARQAFISRDTNHSGTIPAVEFVSLMKSIRTFRMSEYVQEHLLSVAGGSPARQVSFAYFKAFNQFLGNLDIMEKIMHSATGSDPKVKVTQAQLLQEAQNYAQVTPLQVSFLFDLCSMEEKTTGAISVDDFTRLLPRPPTISYKTSESMPPVDVVNEKPVPMWMKIVQPFYRFALGSIAGATGATAVYPIDLVKTRLQNQRGSLAGEIMYKNSFDCFFKVIKNEGVFGLYRGLLPQLVGVSPEKAIKLTANDTMRGLLKNKDGYLPLWGEIIAGGCGGMCQVTFTNPLEIVKIRLQVAGEMAQTAKLGAAKVIRELGFRGLYKGASACFLRDIPFSAIYFPLYAHLKAGMANEYGHNSALSLFVSGFIAGVPAAGLLTPADVIKTRLQVKARKGQQTYNGLVDCARKIYAAEGGRAFWKGAPARIFRSSPQFGVTLLTYELLQRLFAVDFGDKPAPPSTVIQPTKPVDTTPFHLPDHVGGYRKANLAFAGIESRFGLAFQRKIQPSQ